MRGAGRWLALIALSIALIVCIFLLVRHTSLDRGSKLSEVASFVLALALVLIPVIIKTFRWLSLKRITDDEIEADAAELAAGLRGEWEREQSLRREDDAITAMRLRWEMPTERGDLHGSFGEILLAFSLTSSRRLVILGDSGAGKSTLVLELARGLAESRPPGDQVPVVLHIARWNPSRKLADWVAEQLARDHPGLARRGRSQSGRVVTHAQALVSQGKVILILDGLDEMAAPQRAAALAEINRHGMDKPLVVASRTAAYRDAVRGNGGRTVARATELTLCDLGPAEIREFLAPVPDERWGRLFERLEAEPRGSLALALGNPLMLSLCRAIYTDRSPDELADRYRFAQRSAIEDHLLGRFVHAAYAAASSPADVGKFRCTGQQAQRWLSFLAGRPAGPPCWGPDREERETSAPDLSWWHLGRAEHGVWWRLWRSLGPVVRVILRITVIAAAAAWILVRPDYWRHGWYRGVMHVGNLLAGGPLASAARPLMDHLLPPVYADFIIAGIAAIFLLATTISYTTNRRVPVRLSIRPFQTLRVVLAVTGVLLLAAAGVTIWGLTQYRHHLPVVTVLDSRSTLLTLLAVALTGGVLCIPATFIADTDRRGAVSPHESLRLDRQADAVTTLLTRSMLLAILGLWAGAPIAIAYAVYATASTLIALWLGGRASFVSRSYTDACWSLGLSRRLPRQVMAFMADAESRGILRAAGAYYEFRHIRVQQQLRDSWGRSQRLGPRTRREKRRDLWEQNTQPEKSLAGLIHTAEEYRALAGHGDSPAFGKFGPRLAVSLTRLAAKLHALGREDDQVDVISERTEVYRDLAERDHGTFGPRLAESLGELATRLAELERFAESIGTRREAADLWRELAQADAGYQLDLAGTLGYLVRDLRPLARHADSLEAIGDTVECLRELEPGDATFRPWLAEALVEQAVTLRASGRSSEYQQVRAQALDVYRALGREKQHHDKKRDDIEDALAVALSPPESGGTNSNHVEQAGEKRKQTKRTLDKLSETAETYWNLAKAESGAFLPDLVRTLDRTSDWRFATIRTDDLHAASHAARRIESAYLDGHENYYLWGRLGPYHLLSELALPLWKAGQYQDALTAIEIARGLGRESYTGLHPEKMIHIPPWELRLYRWRRILAERGWSLAIGNRDWQKYHAYSLSVTAGYRDDNAFDLAVQGRRTEAKAMTAASVTAYREAIDIYRELSETQPTAYLPHLATSLEALAAELRKTGEPVGGEDAEDASAEATMLRRHLGLSPHHPEPAT